MGNPAFFADSALDTATVTSLPTADTDFPVTALFDDRPFELYKNGTTDTEVIIKSDAGGGNTDDVDYLAIYAHDLFDPASDGNGAVIWFLEWSDDDAAWTEISTDTATDNKIIIRAFATTETHRYFRLRLTRAGTFIVSIGQVQWGERVEMPHGVQIGFDPEAEMTERNTTRSKTGNRLGAVFIFSDRLFPVNIPLVTDVFLRDETTGGFKDFWDNHANEGSPFFSWWNIGDAGSFEKDAFWGSVSGRSRIQRPLRTQVSEGKRDLRFEVDGIKES